MTRATDEPLVLRDPGPVRVPRRGPRSPSAVAVVAIVVGLAGAGIRLSVLLGNGGLLGSPGYDDGVYYAAAAAFVHGRWPYADFLLLHPPVVVLAGAPFAALGAVAGDPAGVVAARLAWIAVGAASCALIVLLAGRRSLPAGLIAGAVTATFFPLAYGERSMLLEPLGTFVLLVALLLRRRGGPRSALVAGLVAGVAVDVKAWYVLPVLLLAAFGPDRLRFLAGSVASAAVVAAPFLLHAPGAMVRQVVLDQIGRPHGPDAGVRSRIVTLTGARYTNGGHDLPLEPATIVAAVIVPAVAICAVLAWRSRLGRQAVVLLVATTAVLLVSPSFFTHYAAFTGPWAAIVVGCGAGAAIDRLPRPALGHGALVILTALVVLPTLGRDLAAGRPAPSLAPVAAAAQRVEGCVRSDDPGLLAALDVLSRDLDRGCALWPDVTGWTLDDPRFPALAEDRPLSPAWQRFVTGYLLSGDAVVAHRPGTGLSTASVQDLDALPELARSGAVVLRSTGP